ncbi:MAG: tryptophan--tRNA ligase [Patescibacteria group bacterium]|nr:tryptophan--tRNA ligase [Patescibacteria group bacterium]
MNKIVLSGYQPTGKVHIGNYLGSLKNFVQLQHKYQCFFFIADYHSITENYKIEEKQKQIINTAKSFLAAGLDPKKCTIYVQSHIPEVFELTWIFNCLTSFSELKRMTQFKDKSSRQPENINIGLFDYPVLQAADILLYKTNLVPVGEDQVQHLELTRKIARNFNQRFGQYFEEPNELLTKTARVMSLNKPQEKMSKSLGEKSYIALTDSPEIVKKKISSAITATSGGEKSPGVKNLFTLLNEFSEKNIYKEFKKEEKQGTIKYSKLKEKLSKNIADYFEDFRNKFNSLKDKEVLKILDQGAKKARPLAQKTLKEVKEKMGLI